MQVRQPGIQFTTLWIVASKKTPLLFAVKQPVESQAAHPGWQGIHLLESEPL